MVSLDPKIPQNFCGGWYWYKAMYSSINPCSSSKRTGMYLQAVLWRSIYFVGERPSQPDMMWWWMLSFSIPQIQHVSSSSWKLKTWFLIYLVEISCSWMPATVDSYVTLKNNSRRRTRLEKLGKLYSERKACREKWLATLCLSDRQTNVHYMVPMFEQLG